MFRSLRSRIAVPYIIMVIIGSLVLAITTTTHLRNVFLDVYHQKLLDECSLLGELVGADLYNGIPSKELDNQAKHYAKILNTRVTFIALDGTVLGESVANRSKMDNHYYRTDVYQAIHKGEGTALRYSTTMQQNMIYSAKLVAFQNTDVGIVRLSIPESTFNSYLDQVNRTTAILAIILVIISSLISIYVANNFTAPIREISEKIALIGKGQFGQYLVHTRSQELLDLNQSLNKMGDAFSQHLKTITSERNRLSVVLEQMADGALILDHMGKVEYINPAALQLLNIESEEAVGFYFAEVVRYHQIIELWGHCLETGQRQGGLVETSGEQGRFLQVILTPFIEFQRRGYLLTLQDLTALRRLETIRRDFISNISHDLRTPITSLRLMTETLQNGAVNDPKMAERFLDLMGKSIETMSQLVEELLEHSRTQSGKVPLQQKPVILSSIIKPAVDRLQPQASRSKLNLSWQVPGDLPLVMVDYDRINSVITNLIHNAIKFTLPGGEIFISARTDAEMVIVSITDTGIGIPKKDAKMIFKRFYKADRARTSKGMGLGLSIAKTIVEEHSGKIWVTSKVGKGSTFYFSIPTVKSQQHIDEQDGE